MAGRKRHVDLRDVRDVEPATKRPKKLSVDVTIPFASNSRYVVRSVVLKDILQSASFASLSTLPIVLPDDALLSLRG